MGSDLGYDMKWLSVRVVMMRRRLKRVVAGGVRRSDGGGCRSRSCIFDCRGVMVND